MCIRGYIYIGPHLLLANTHRGGPHPPPARSRGEESAARLGCRASTVPPSKVVVGESGSRGTVVAALLPTPPPSQVK